MKTFKLRLSSLISVIGSQAQVSILTPSLLPRSANKQTNGETETENKSKVLRRKSLPAPIRSIAGWRSLALVLQFKTQVRPLLETAQATFWEEKPKIKNWSTCEHKKKPHTPSGDTASLSIISSRFTGQFQVGKNPTPPPPPQAKYHSRAHWHETQKDANVVGEERLFQGSHSLLFARGPRLGVGRSAREGN